MYVRYAYRVGADGDAVVPTSGFSLGGEFEPALRSLDEALRLSPGVAEWHYRRGMAREQSGDIQRAEEDYVRAAIANGASDTRPAHNRKPDQSN